MNCAKKNPAIFSGILLINRLNNPSDKGIVG